MTNEETTNRRDATRGPKENARTEPANSGPRHVSSNTIRWEDLPKTLQIALERTPRAHWYKIRPTLVMSPETHKILDIARLVDQILPRSTLGVRRKISIEERARKAQELTENLNAFWTAVDALEATLERLARAAGVWGLIIQRGKARQAPPAPKPERKPQPAAPPRVVPAAPPRAPVAPVVPVEDDADDVDPDAEAAA